MYTRDREGIVGDIEPPAGGKKDLQAANCDKHILFGHGNQVEDVRIS